MNATIERRNSDRHACDCEASWSYFNKEGAAAGRILNFSRSGSYLEIDQPMIPGATVLIRILKCSSPAAAHPDALPLNAVAEVTPVPLDHSPWPRASAGSSGTRTCFSSGLGMGGNEGRPAAAASD